MAIRAVLRRHSPVFVTAIALEFVIDRVRPKVLLSISTFAVVSLGALWLAVTRKCLPVAAQRAAA